MHRHAYLTNALHGLKFEWVYGVDKNDLSENKVGEYYDHKGRLNVSRSKKPIKIGQLACAISHQEAYKKALQNGDETILIFEDDVEINEASMDSLEESLRHLPDDWELVYFGFWKNEERGLTGYLKQFLYFLQSLAGAHKWSAKRIWNIYPREFSKHFKLAGNHEGGHAYALKSTAIKKLVDLNSPVIMHSDHALAHLATNEEVRAYIISQPVFNQHSKKHHPDFIPETV